MTDHIIEMKLITEVLNTKLKNQIVTGVYFDKESNKNMNYIPFNIKGVECKDNIIYFNCDNKNGSFYILTFMGHNSYWEISSNKITSSTFYMKLQSGSYVSILDTDYNSIVRFTNKKDILSKHISDYGPDVSSDEFSLKYWKEITKNNTSKVTWFLME